MLSVNTEKFIGCDSDYNNADIVLFGAPFDGTTSFRPGARFGPKSMRADSFGIETYSPYQQRDLLDLKVFDFGDLDLPFGNTKKVLKIIEKYTQQVLNGQKVPIMLGGEHLATLGTVSALLKKHPDLNIIQFDAHADLRDEYLGEKLSHATVMRRIWDQVGDNRIYQFGIRSGERDEFLFAQNHTCLNKFNLKSLSAVLPRLTKKPIYVTIDLDVMDPSVFAGTGTPEPGGVGFCELLDAIISLFGLNIVGCDLTELSPHYDQSGVSTAVACKVLRELLLAVC